MINLKQILEGKDSEDAAGIAYFFNDTLLCCQNNEGRWGVPKGHIHVDEKPEEGALREFSEETQIILNKPIEMIRVWSAAACEDLNVCSETATMLVQLIPSECSSRLVEMRKRPLSVPSATKPEKPSILLASPSCA